MSEPQENRAPGTGPSEGDSNQQPAAEVRVSTAGVHETVSSVWPMVIAGAVAFTAFGVVTNYAFAAFGLVVLAIGIVGWVGELIRE